MGNNYPTSNWEDYLKEIGEHMRDKGFFMVDIIFGLSIIILISFLIIFSIKNSIKLNEKNNMKLELLNTTDNFISEFTNFKDKNIEIENLRNQLSNSSKLCITKDDINIDILKTDIGNNLSVLNFNSYYNNLYSIELVIVIENF